MKNNYKMHFFIIIIILAVAGGFYYRWYNLNKSQKDNTQTTSDSKENSQETAELIQKTIEKIAPTPNSDLSTKEFTNTDHDITIKYPDDWISADLGGDKNVTEPLKRENIGFFYLPNSEVREENPNTAIVSVKLIRFVVEDGITINSADDWYDYIKKKIDDFIASPVLSANYEFKGLNKSEIFSGKFVVIEDYVENNLITGKDYYVYQKGQLYQFVTKAPNAYFSQYVSIIEKIVQSAQFGK